MGAVKAAFELEVAEQGVEGKPGPRHICLSQLEGWVFCFLNLEQKETDSDKGSGCLPRLLSSSQGLGVLHNETRPGQFQGAWCAEVSGEWWTRLLGVL